MDSVTHGLVGAAAGLSILAVSQRNRIATAGVTRAAYEERWVAALCGLIAGELPDADRVLDHCFNRFGVDGQGLAYMLYHRGPTHTVLACFLAAPVLAILTRAAARRISPPLSVLLVIAATGLSSHLAMDGMNDYGIHPFLSLSRRWFYGDFLFLAEPTVWVSLLPYISLMLGLETKWLNALCLSVAVVLAALVVTKQWLTPFGATVAVLLLIAQALLQRSGPRPISAWASVGLVLLVFFSASRFARRQAASWTAELSPGAPLIDVVTTPAPANPFCWRVITIAGDADAFVVRMGMISFSGLVDARTCYAPPNGIMPSSVCGLARCRPLRQNVLQFAEFGQSRREFERIAKLQPRVAATRHFLRVPFWGLDARFNACEPVTNPDHDAASICTRAAASSDHGSCPRPDRFLIGDLRVDYDKNDVGAFCKYPFSEHPMERYESNFPLGDPPFFRGLRTHDASQ